MPGADEREVARVLGAGDDYQVTALAQSQLRTPCGGAACSLVAATCFG